MTSSPERAGDAARAPRRPDFFIVGQPKSGTTALYEILRRHPQIYMSARKEPVFMASDLHAGLWSTVRTRPRTLEAYLALFAPARPEQRAGEASTVYLWSSEAARNIAALAPDARIIAILREPASFLRSLHLQLLQNFVETERDLGRAIALERDRREGRELPRDCPFPQALMYSERVRYVDQLRRYERVLGSERMLVLVYDDFRADNETTVRRILRFLEVDDGAPIETLEANPTIRVRSRRLQDAVRVAPLAGGPVARGVTGAVKALTSRRARHAALRLARRRLLYAEPPPRDEATMLELRRRCKPEVLALADYLNRDLVSLWGYGGIG